MGTLFIYAKASPTKRPAAKQQLSGSITNPKTYPLSFAHLSKTTFPFRKELFSEKAAESEYPNATLATLQNSIDPV